MTLRELEADPQVLAVREFNRFYTRQMGLLDEGLLGSVYSLTEVRVLFELARLGRTAASDIADELGLDSGYLSRILKRFEHEQLIRRSRSVTDGRSSAVELTDRGREVFGPLDEASSRQVGAMLGPLGEVGRDRLVRSMSVIRGLLERRPEATPRAVVLRSHQPGDIGWAICRHGEIYADEYGWNGEFEGLVAVILGKFLEKHDPSRERAWIAEVDGVRAGCVFLVQNADDPEAGQLRCLLVEPAARGLGVGRKLVEACVACARQSGYRRLVLWTNSQLAAARKLYEACRFEMLAEEPHHSFGHDLVGQTWGLEFFTKG